ncbi:MAG TPA: YdeI/OmpD-associated family protein [Cytophagaceae bacterium]|jgi:hypothetical protein|nr:YdeI/OmpD-associated family protein [Cytophagaceae bacterium]
MIHFTATILQFGKKGEKTSWSYIPIAADQAEELKPNNRKSFRVKGKLDNYTFEGIALLPIGDGDFIMALNATVRKNIRKEKGAMVKVQMEVDTKKKKLSADFLVCLADESKALKYFKTLPKSHQQYFSTWIESAKTDATKDKRIAQAVNALSMSLGFNEMMRMNRKKDFF